MIPELIVIGAFLVLLWLSVRADEQHVSRWGRPWDRGAKSPDNLYRHRL